MGGSPRYYGALFLGIMFLLGSTTIACAQTRVRARVGIQLQSGPRETWAMARETLQAGDMLRVYAIPEEDAYIYLVYSDATTPRLLNNQNYTKKIARGSRAVFPSETEFYQTDGAHPTETFTVICSPQELPEVLTLLSAKNPSHEKWLALEAELVKRSKITLSNTSEKPFPIAGNVRGIVEEKKNHEHVKDLLVYSGESFLVKKYEFSVKK